MSVYIYIHIHLDNPNLHFVCTSDVLASDYLMLLGPSIASVKKLSPSLSRDPVLSRSFDIVSLLQVRPLLYYTHNGSGREIWEVSMICWV